MRAVLDTVIVVRALINQHGHWGHVLFGLRDRYQMVISPEIIREVLDVLHRSSLRGRFPQIDDRALARALSALAGAEIVLPPEEVRVCRDPNDDKFFACAVAGQADYIVSEDKDILDVGEYQGIRTVSATEFIRLVEERGVV